MATMDVFSGDAFSLRTLTAAVNATPFVPGRVGELGVFEERGITTTKVSVERLAEEVAMVQSSPRGAPPEQNNATLRTMYDLNTVRIAVSDTIYADEVQGIRAYGSETETQSLASEVMVRNDLMARKIAATIEFQQFTALQGVTQDADGTELVNSGTVFPGSIPGALDMDLDNSGTTGVNALRGKCSTIIRSIEDALGARPYSSIHAFVHADFFDNLWENDAVINSFQYTNGGPLRDQTARRSLLFGGITFEEYRPLGNGTVPLAAGTGIAFPIGAGIFQTRFAPGDWSDVVNSTGLPLYARTWPDPMGNRFQMLEVQSNVLNVCVEPGAVYPIDDGV